MSTNIDEAPCTHQYVVGSYEWRKSKSINMPGEKLQQPQPLFSPSIGIFRSAENSYTPCSGSTKLPIFRTSKNLLGADPNFHLAPIWVSPPDNSKEKPKNEKPKKKEEIYEEKDGKG